MCRRRRRVRGPAATYGGTAAGIYDLRLLQFKSCAELDEAARLRLTVAGVIRKHPRKWPNRWVRTEEELENLVVHPSFSPFSGMNWHNWVVHPSLCPFSGMNGLHQRFVPIYARFPG